MPNLQYYRKLKYPTIKAFAQAAAITPSIASQWLRASRGDINPDPLCTLLGISQDEYTEAYTFTYEEEQKKWREKHPPTMTLEEWDAHLMETARAMVAKMTPGERKLLHRQAVELGFAVDRRSPLDRMIDDACGLK
jgi:transcriptional regulator with XRE-family HTH domain